MTVVLDSSAILAFLQGEPGADEVEAELEHGAVVSAANWSEAAQKVRARGEEWELSAALLDSYAIAVEPVTRGDAETAARLWRANTGLSLGDRLCLALRERLDLSVLTTDAAWGRSAAVRQLR